MVRDKMRRDLTSTTMNTDDDASVEVSPEINEELWWCAVQRIGRVLLAVAVAVALALIPQ